MKINSCFVIQWKVTQEVIEVGKQLRYVGHKPFPSKLNVHGHIAPFRVCYCHWKSCQAMLVHCLAKSSSLLTSIVTLRMVGGCVSRNCSCKWAHCPFSGCNMQDCATLTVWELIWKNCRTGRRASLYNFARYPICLGMNPGLCGEKLVTRCLSCDPLFFQVTTLHGFSILHKIRSVHKMYVSDYILTTLLEQK